ncbi:hypothetical protein BN7_1761 [Wickerhamomyces ciferrii]|uniref:Uncharacterized protein n=1 Tax=Wickerhamomyces ciferrii (strain ATCC 14091 / BCRC 22168 / CBS 111 / JCM 3599 / NBRC 0793 / NRRL Y-1031 F-60-10) TaxID=1206466 RepID=K0KJB1_WICCF|nr:uncharacterized protein BN7_1761 [Wickerhamomyces ciferrii]CCH42217.1 hypothetical protein BN7_1761 [Wickerhamomyces ciferrii]
MFYSFDYISDELINHVSPGYPQINFAAQIYLYLHFEPFILIIREEVEKEAVFQVKMIRRQPTTITLSPEDVISYDDEKAKQQQQQSLNQNQNSYNQNGNTSQDSVLQRLQSLKSKDERIGLRTSSRN